MPEFKDFAISELELDRENPRLPTRLVGSGEDEILRYLALRTNIEELITSIGENDFFPGEAIVVTKSEATDGLYTVLEGNRRLTALKLLLDPELAASISRGGVLAAVEKAQNRPDHVPAYEVGRREDVLQYLGFRHISGVQRWEPLAKARYLKMLYQQAQGDPDMRYRQIAGEIGSRRDTVRKNLDALAAYEVVVENSFFDIPDLDEESFHFGVFYTALSNSMIADFTGAKNDPVQNPQNLSVKAIREVTIWMFQKDENKKTRLGESRNIYKLAAVVSTPRALAMLRDGATLDDARKETPDLQNEFIREIETATSHVEAANSKMASISIGLDSPEVIRAVSNHESEFNKTKEALKQVSDPNAVSDNADALPRTTDAGA